MKHCNRAATYVFEYCNQFQCWISFGTQHNILKDTIIEKNPVDKVCKIKFVTSISYVFHNNFQRSKEKNSNDEFNFSGTYQRKHYITKLSSLSSENSLVHFGVIREITYMNIM